MDDVAAALEAMDSQETWRQVDATVAWLRSHGRPTMDRCQAVEEAVQDWLGAQWAEHNRGEPLAAPALDGRPRLDRLIEFVDAVTRPLALRPRPRR